jgi:hypothetical protein
MLASILNHFTLSERKLQPKKFYNITHRSHFKNIFFEKMMSDHNQ